jgi:hypothetical protein
MKKQIALMVILSTGIVLAGSPSLGVAEEQVIANPPVVTPAIPPSRACTKSSPCQNLTGEIIRIDEAYWIKTPDGLETRLKVTDGTKIDSLLKKGDKVAAQVTSTGDAEAVVKVEDLPKPPQVSLPSTTFDDIREQQSGLER